MRPLALLSAAALGAEALYTVVKEVVGRPRPSSVDAVQRFAGKAFPSGHATLAAATWCAVAVLAAAGTSRWSRKVLWWALATAVITAVGLSRLYLGAHWLTDVLGGWALGGMWLAAIMTVASGTGGRRDGAAAPTRSEREMASSS